MRIILIAALDIKEGIGRDGTIPWRLKADMEFFKEKTTNTVVIMGRRTFASLNFRPLPNRKNIVISSTLERGTHPHQSGNSYTVYPTLYEALEFLHPFMTYSPGSPSVDTRNEEVYIIGGSALYKEALPMADQILLTRINKDFECDTHFPFKGIGHNFTLMDHVPHAGPDFTYSFQNWKRWERK